MKNGLTDQQQTMFDLIEGYQTAGTTRKDYCIEHGLPEWKFYYWQKRYQEYHQPGGFIPVKIGKAKRQGLPAPMKIVYPNGVVIELPGELSLTTIRTLIGLV